MNIYLVKEDIITKNQKIHRGGGQRLHRRGQRFRRRRTNYK
jgi:hypothetical protein